jgi:competence protein ComEA
MSFYRSLLAAVAAVAIASPVFADDAANAMQNPADEAAAAPAAAQQIADNSSTQATDNSTSTDQQATDQTAGAKVSLNSATAKDLMKIKGINAAKAKAIVAYRKKHGDFKTVEDLKKVKGFSKIKAEKLKALEDQLDI